MNDNLFYDRTSNISGATLVDIGNYQPVYGSSVSFSSSNAIFNADDNYYQLSPKGLNNLSAVFNLKYKTDKRGAQELANYYETSNGSLWVDVITDREIYKDIKGYCLKYDINHTNNQNYEFSTSIEITESPGIINWSGMNYLNPDFEDWTEAKTYKKHDIVYTGVNEVKLNNFFYCSEDHLSSDSNSPTGVNSSWTQEFSWDPDIGTTSSVTMDVNRLDAGFSTFNKIKKNSSKLKTEYSFSNISTKQLKSMLHFLENKAGYRRFEHKSKSVYNRPKVYYCPSWTHTWVYDNNHTLQVMFEEDYLGIIPKNS